MAVITVARNSFLRPISFVGLSEAKKLVRITEARLVPGLVNVDGHHFSSSFCQNMQLNRKPTVYVTRPDIPLKALDLLKQRCDVETWSEATPVPRGELLQKISGKDALFCLLTEKINSELLNAAGPQLKVIATMSVGYDHINLEACKKRNILLGYTPDVLTDATAELTVALLLATSRRLFEASSQVTNGGWGAWSPLWMCGTALKDSTVGIVGLGRIGRAVVERLTPFKVSKFLYSGRSPKPEAKSLNAHFVSKECLLRESDFVIVCCALTEDTRKMFDKQAFNAMKPTAIFINTSRGGIVDHEALHEALKSGRILAAGLDVMDPEPLPTDHPLTKLKNCVLLPHIGSATVETRTAMAMTTVANILAGLEGRPLPASL